MMEGVVKANGPGRRGRRPPTTDAVSLLRSETAQMSGAIYVRLHDLTKWKTVSYNP